MPDSNKLPSSTDMQSWLDRIGQVLAFIFSWIILLSVGVIVSGMFLADVMPMKGVSKTHFTIPLYIFRIEARNGEVVLGISGFLITLLFVAVLGGGSLYTFAIGRFGIDPGQFNTLCFTSGLITVFWSFTLWLIFKRKGISVDEQETSRLLKKIETRSKSRLSEVESDDRAAITGDTNE